MFFFGLPDLLYLLLRGWAGFALMVSGLSFMLAPAQDRVRFHLGILFVAAGFLFCLSALDPAFGLPIDPGNLLVLTALLVLGQALFEIAVYFFGSERFKAFSPWILRAGVAWSLLVGLLPLLDYSFGWQAVATSAEDGASLGPLHAVAAVAVYGWPLAITGIAAWIGLGSLRGLPLKVPGAKVFAIGALILIGVLLVILLGLAVSSVAVYRAGHVALELTLLAWYLVLASRPQFLPAVRAEIRAVQSKALVLSPGENALIDERLARIESDSTIVCQSGFDLEALASLLGLPAYRLSAYLGRRLQCSFSVWLNRRRVEIVKARMAAEPERSIIDLAMDAGYSSKSAFNNQFAKLAGMSPSAWRKEALALAEGERKNPD